MSILKRILCGLMALLLALVALPSARRESRAATQSAANRSGIDLRFITPDLAMPREIAVLAHRGASGYRRENTPQAFLLAGELGADMVELDVRETADGQLAVVHNATVGAGFRGVRRVSELTLAQLQAIRPSITTLDVALSCIAGTGMGVMIELKTSGVEQQALNCVDANGMRDRALFASFSTDVLQTIQALRPDARTAYLVREKATLNSLLRRPEQSGFDVIAAKYTLLSAAKVRSLHQNGWQVIAWTVNNISDLRLIANMDVDGVITDYPDRVRS